MPQGAKGPPLMTNIHSLPPVFFKLQGLYNVKAEPRVCSVNGSTEMEEVYTSAAIGDRSPAAPDSSPE